MKTFVTLIVGMILGGIVMSVLSYARHATYMSGYISNVEWPIKRCLEDIVHTYDNGDAALAEAKVRRLDKLWHDHYGSVEPMGGLYEEVYNLQIEEAPQAP